MASVHLKNLAARYGSLLVVDDVSLEIASGEFVVLLGPSGCGKTITLRMLAGFVQPSEGRLFFDGADVTDSPPRKREIGMVFQNYALFPTMTVEQNIGFPLRQRKFDRAHINERVTELLRLVQLEKLAHSYPSELSGGQQQRVALARALAFSPKLLLMDEPLGALDQKLRDDLQLELHRIQRQLGITTVLVTHDQQEAMLLADRIVIMSDGRIQQVGTPLELYRNPANQFVADFIGKSNILSGTLERGPSGDVLRCGADTAFAARSVPDCDLGKSASLVIRPEDIVLSPGAEHPAPKFAGVVERRLFLGNIAQYFIRLPSGELLQAEQHGATDGLNEGEAVGLSWDVGKACLFLQEAGK